MWAEIWEDIGPRIDSVLEPAIATWDEDLLLFLERSGYPEETYHTFSYSPLADDDGAVGRDAVRGGRGDRPRAVGERRMATLRELGADLAVTGSERRPSRPWRTGSAANLRDLPFALVYLFDDAARPAGLRHRHRRASQPSRAGDAMARRPRLCDGETVVVEDLRPGLPSGAWPDPPSRPSWCR